jgi:hypothetical protein
LNLSGDLEIFYVGKFEDDWIRDNMRYPDGGVGRKENITVDQ